MSSLSSSHNQSDKSVKLPTTEERKKWLQSDKGSQSMTSYTTSTNANKKKLLFHSSSMITYGTKNVSYFALKSILLDRCACDKLKDELRNEGTYCRAPTSNSDRAFSNRKWTVEILKSLDHPNIVRAIETFEYHKRLYIVLELCSGRDPYSENEAARILTSLFKVVAYLHKNGIVHRDLKYEVSILLQEDLERYALSLSLHVTRTSCLSTTRRTQRSKSLTLDCRKSLRTMST